LADNWATEVFPAIRRAAKLPTTVTMHCLRHSFASLLLGNQAPITHVSEQLGHTSVAFTMTTCREVLKVTRAG
jgi:integrase